MEAMLSVLKWIIEGLAILVLGVISWVVSREVDKTDRTKDDLVALRTHIAENYENRNSIQMSLARIHTRIDETQQNITDGFDGLQEDIKKILTNCASRNKC